MTRSTQLIITLFFASFSLLIIQFVRSTKSASQLIAVQNQLNSVQIDVQELHRLSSQSANHIYGSPPDADVQAAVADVLEWIGLPANTAVSIRRESDRQLNHDPTQSRIRIREMSIELRSISPPVLGEFLKRWRDQEPAWTVHAISLRKSTSRASKANEYHVNLTCIARYTDTRPDP